MKDYIFPILLVLMAVYFIIADLGSDAREQAMQAKWDRERDSLTTANKLITLRFDSARAESIAHEQRAESLATVPRTIYITNATRLTSGAPLDSLGILFFADPFTAVPDTIVDHHEP